MRSHLRPRMLSRRSFRPSVSGFAGSGPLVGLIAIAGFAVACGGSAEPAAAPPPPVATVPAAPPPTLTAVPEPAGLVFAARVNHPDKLISAAGAWTGLPMPDPSKVANLIAGDEFGPLLDATQPIDAAVTFIPGTKPQADLAVSGALLSLEDAKAKVGQKHKLVPGDNGVYKIRPAGAGVDKSAATDSDDDDDDRVCALAPAFGSAKGRLVCADSNASLDMLLPYLTRTATRAAVDSDVHIEMRTQVLEPSLEMVKQMMPMLLSGLSSAATSKDTFALIDAMTNDLIQLTGDVRRWTIDVRANDAGLKMHSDVRLQSAKSVVSQLLVAHPERADAPPAVFFQLPADADTAFYSRAGDAALIDHPVHLFTAALADLAEQAGVAQADAKAGSAAIADLLMLGGAQAVSAHGVDSAAVKKALDDVRAADKTDSAKREDALFALVQARVGWWVAARTIPASQVNSAFKELVSANQRPSFAKVWSSSLKGVSFPHLRSGGAVKGAPAGTTHYSIELPSLAKLIDPDSDGQPSKMIGRDSAPGSKHAATNKAAAGEKKRVFKPLPFHILVVADGDQTWIAVGCDENVALQHLKVAMAAGGTGGAGAGATLASRAGLEQLKTSRSTSGGFLDSHNFAGSPLVDWLKNRESPQSAAMMESVKGITPMTFVSTSLAPAGDAEAGSAVVDITIPRDSFQEVTRTFVAAMESK